MAERNGFIIHEESYRSFERLSDERLGKLFRAMYKYASDGEAQTFLEDEVLDIIFETIRDRMDRDALRYEETCKARSEAGKKGGRPKKANGFPEKAKKANGFFEKQTKAKKAYRECDSDSKCDPDPDPVPECECDRESARADSTPPPTQQKMTLHGVMELAKRLGYPWDEQEAREFLVYNLDKKDRQGDWNWAAQKWEEHREERKHWKSGKAKSTSAVSQRELDDLDEYLGLSNRFMGGGNDDG